MGTSLRRHAIHAAVALAVAVPLILVAAAPSAAAAAPQPPTQSSGLICQSQQSVSTGKYSSANLLPINRWGSAAGGDMHTDLAGGVLGSITSLPESIQRNFIISTAMSVGNALWGAGADLTEMASAFCFSHQAGLQADQIASGLGSALSNSGIFVILAVLSFGVLAWRAVRRAEQPFGKMLRFAVFAGVFSAMVAGASASNGSSFGTFSPGWFTTNLYGAVSNVASYPVAAISSVASKLAASGSSITGITSNAGGMTCASYVNELLTQYEQSYGQGVFTNAQATVPMSLNAMWMQSGLQSYIAAQFGNGNSYGQDTYCHLLDDEVGVKASSQKGIVYGAGGSPAPVPGASLAFASPGSSNQTVDESIIGWAACRYSGGHWSVAPGWAQVTAPATTGAFGSLVGDGPGGGTFTPQACQQWWSTNSGSGTPFDWSSSASNIVTATASQPAVANFLLNFHGDQNGNATVAALGFALASVVVFAVFAVLAGAVVMAKFALLILMALFVVFLVVDLFPSSGGQSKSLAFARQALAYMILATGAQIILTLVAIFTGFISQLGTSVSGAGSLLSIVWLSFAPVAAIFVLHHLFKSLRVPSPFKLTSGLAWGAAAGGIGAGIGAGLEGMLSRGRRAATSAVADQTIGRARRSYGAPRSERPVNAMRPGEDPLTRRQARSASDAGTQDTPTGETVNGAPTTGPTGETVNGAPTTGPTPGARTETTSPAVVAGPEGAAGQDEWTSYTRRRAQTVAQERIGRKLMREDATSHGHTLGARVSDRAALAMERFRTKPIRNALKLAGAGVAAMAIPFGMAPALGIVTAAYAIHKAKQARAERPILRAERRNAYVQAAMRQQAKAEQPRQLPNQDNTEPPAPPSTGQPSPPSPPPPDPRSPVGPQSGPQPGPRPVPSVGPSNGHAAPSQAPSSVPVDGQGAPSTPSRRRRGRQEWVPPGQVGPRSSRRQQ
jgi:hypothetical protein